MVKNPGTTSCPHHLRALNEPRPIQVLAEQGHPVAIIESTRRDIIEQVQDTWIVQDEWWRQEIDRQYYNLLLRNGNVRTIYHDRLADTWFEQAY